MLLGVWRWGGIVLAMVVGLSACSPPSVEVADPTATMECPRIARAAVDELMRRTEEFADVVPGEDAGPRAETALTWLQGTHRRPLHGLAGRDFEARWTELGCTDEDEFEVLDEWLTSFDRADWEAERLAADERGDARFPVQLIVPAQLMLRHSGLDPSRPREPVPHAVEDLSELEPDAEGVLFRIHMPDGEPQGLTLLADGSVIVLADSSVHAGRDAIAQWQVDDATVDEVVGLLLAPEVLADLGPPPSNGSGSDEAASMVYGGCCAVGLPPTLARAAVDLLSDPGRYVEPPRRYIPSTLSVQARRVEVTEGAPSDLAPAQPWPLDRSIAALSQDVTHDPTGELVLQLCLHDDDAAAVWNLLVPGTNRAWLVVDDGASWYLNISLRLPGYRSVLDRCYPAGG